jgi:hypothetical protein
MPNDKKDGIGDSQKRPHATLDLKATDVTPPDPKPEPSKETAAAAAKSPDGKTTSAASASAASSAGGGGKAPYSKPSLAKPAAEGPPAGPPRAGPGRVLSHLLAGVAGGLLAFAAAEWAAPRFGISTAASQVQARAEQLQRRLSALEQTAGSEISQKLKDNESRLAKLEVDGQAVLAAQTRLVEDGKALAGKLAGDTLSDAAQARMTALEDRLATIAKAAEGGQGGSVPQVTALTGKISDLQTATADQVAGLRSELRNDVETRAADLGQKIGTALSGTQRLEKDLIDAKTELARLDQRMEVLKATADKVAASQRVLQEESAKLTSGFEDVKGTVASQVQGGVGQALSPVTSRVAELETELDKVRKSEESRRENAERVVISLELANLKRQIDSGQGFSSGLDQVRKASSAKLNLTALERYKDAGVPTLADLQRDFRPVANAVIDAAATPVEGGVIDKLVAGAKSVVRVRNLNPDAADKSAEAVVARMQEALTLGQLGDVLAFAKDLPPAAAAPAQEWLAKVEARNAVDRAIGDIETQLKSSLTAAEAVPPAPAPAPPAAAGQPPAAAQP